MRKKKSFSEKINGLWIHLLHHFARHLFPSQIRCALHRLRGVKIGNNVLIGLDVHIDDDSPNQIIIEDNVTIASGSMIISHQRDLTRYKFGDWFGDMPFQYGRIIIKKNVFIGVRSIILPGVIIGEGAIIGAGSLINCNVPAYSLAVGVPVRIINKY